MQTQKFITRAGQGTANALIDAAAEVLTIDCEDLENMSLIVEQVADAGTVILVVEKSMDGTCWIPFGANITEATFAAGANQGVERTNSDANGMPLVCKQVRVTASALAGGGTYRIKAAGKQRYGYR